MTDKSDDPGPEDQGIVQPGDSGSDDDSHRIHVPEEASFLTMREVVVFPGMVVPLVVSGESSVKLVDDVTIGDKLLGVAAQRDSEVESPQPEDLFGVGTLAIVLKMLRIPDGTLRILIQGIARVRLDEFVQTEPYFRAKITELHEVTETNVQVEALTKNIAAQFQRVVSLAQHLPDELQVAAMNIDDAARLADFACANLRSSTQEKQEVLETLGVRERLEKVTQLVNKELEVLEISSKIQNDVQSEVGKSQREYYLREQLKAIQKELGEEDERVVEVRELKEKIEKADMPPDVAKEANREADRLLKIPPGSAEYTVARTYMDWLVSLPWSVSTDDNLDISAAQKVLDEDHFGLDKLKERILEYLAVRKLKADMKGPILCFVGPPGTGKTSLGRSIARALGREFVRISLGGVRDEAEIRGHRRTYVGALPGRIIQGMRKAGSNNPLFMLDEVDKLGTDFRGDPSSALLEVLDPEQNNTFADHYLDVPFDLSKTMFITTGNLLDPIPPALRDRMEVLELAGYTREEKVVIAQRHLVPKQLKEHGLDEVGITFAKGAIVRLIVDYTREAGLRNLEREIANVCRKIGRNIAQNKRHRKKVTAQSVPSFLGPPRFISEVEERTGEPGVAVGLAWNQAGGDVIFVESTQMRGSKGLMITGQLGDVMKESAQAALSYVRAHADDLKIGPEVFAKSDIHIHVPAGSIPKDGPSAGVTIATSLVSLLTGKPTNPDVAMTGEITLRGKVLPVGGVKEKVLAAKRAGIKKVILPRHNEKDLQDIPPELQQTMSFAFVDTVDEVLAAAWSDGGGRKAKRAEEQAS